MTSLKAGAKAPPFSALNQDEAEHTLKNFSGKYLVLYFYPKALTPGCTTQACGVRDIKSELDSKGVVVIGVSPDSPAKLRRFHDKNQLNFDLLSDENHEIAKAYDVWGLKKFMGKQFMGVIRTTFIIDPAGKIVAIFDNFTTKSHHQELLDWFASH
ncbi:MAG: thioredoxin-dependent thiol peroxidase [Cellvibrionaceae bacterium]|nr:thioredoxin-dependent thiol peroxidase [Cellvibrionaceae bacterium]